MSAIPITLFFSLLLAATFVVLFARDHRRRRFASAERDSLLPLADETPRVADFHADHDHDHDHGVDNCGCHDGSRPPCPGCLRRRDAPAPTVP